MKERQHRHRAALDWDSITRDRFVRWRLRLRSHNAVPVLVVGQAPDGGHLCLGSSLEETMIVVYLRALLIQLAHPEESSEELCKRLKEAVWP
mgnify:CR=1 FL=1